MADDAIPLDVPIPLEEVDESQGPIAVPPPHPHPVGAPVGIIHPQPVPVPVIKKKDVIDEPISLVDFDDDEEMPTQRKAIGKAGLGLERKTEFNRPMNKTGQGATRCRLFNSKISEVPLLHMENVINDWIDEEGVEVKQVTQCIGTMEGKHADPNLLVLVWY